MGTVAKAAQDDKWQQSSKSAAPGRANGEAQLTMIDYEESKMAEQIVAVQKKQEYTLDPADRRALISQSRHGQRELLIERQRAAFVQKYGDPFGPVQFCSKS